MKTYLAISAFMWTSIGLLCAVAPSAITPLVGFSFLGTQGIVEFIAVYGGLEIGLGLFYFAALRDPTLQRGALTLSLTLLGAIVSTRIIAIASHGTDIGMAWLYFSVESIMFAAAVYLTNERSRMPKD